ASAGAPSSRDTPTPCQLRQVPHLRSGAVAVPDLELRPVRRVPVRVVEAPAGLRVEEALPGAVAPLLRAASVAVPQLHLRAVPGAAAGDVDALAEHVDCAVARRPRERLRGAARAVPELDRRPVRGRAARVVDA